MKIIGHVSLACSQNVSGSRRPGHLLLVLASIAMHALCATPAHAEEPGWSFVRGINVNGPSVTIDGRKWEADKNVKDFVCKDQRFENQNVRLKPSTDDARTRMIRSSFYQPNGNNAVTLNRVPNGSYRVYLYTWEDTNSQTTRISLEGKVFAANYQSGSAGTWRRLGPWDVAISDGSLNLNCRGGHANLSGLEIWKRTSSAVVAKISPPARTAPTSSRVTRDLQVLYTFDAGRGETVVDRSGTGSPTDLKIEKPAAIQWQPGRLVVRSATRITSAEPPRKIIDAVKRSQAITIESWIRPGNDRQAGPARIVSLSRDANQRNFTLGQDGSRFDVRLRTRSTSTNGIPSTATRGKSLRSRLTHVVYTRDGSGNARIYLDGKQQASKKVSGDLANWDSKFRLSLANELTGDRPWLGELHLVAIYSRALAEKEVMQNFRAGSAVASPALVARQQPVKPSPPLAAEAAAESARLFDAHVAPLLLRHCVECHGPTKKKGGLDLSQKLTALAGGESGKGIVPGKSPESLVWEYVSSDEMPADRTPLSSREKRHLQQWIDTGAVWVGNVKLPYQPQRPDAENWLRRLTVTEYIESVRSAVGVDIEKDARRILPRDFRADGFSNTAYNLGVDLEHVEAYAELAEIIVSRMDLAGFAAQYTGRRDLNDANMRNVIAGMGKWLLRGPLEEHEIGSFLRVSNAVASRGGDFDQAVSYVVQAMLQSPRFIYRIEQQRGDGKARPVGDYELASRLSYILWGGPPDKELMRAADAGELSARRRVDAQVRRMLEDPRAVERSLHFVDEWLHLDRLDNLRPNQKRFPKWDAPLAADMRQETLAFFEDIVWKQRRPLADLLNAQFTYATPRLAAHYGIKPAGKGLSRYDLTSEPSRGGLLTQGSVLTIGGDDASMVTRGLFVLNDLLFSEVGAPPPGLDTTPVPASPGRSHRAIAMERVTSKSCGGCHSRFEPLAFGLEKFDGLGTFHEQDEYGNKLHEDGEILFPGSDKPVPYASSAEMMDLLAKSERVRMAITRKVTQFALGRPLVETDAPILDQIHRTAQQGGGSYASLITAIVISDLVQKTQTEKR